MSGTAEERLGGRYRLLDLIGVGGMAVVWRARDEVLGRDVAVKLLSLDLAGDGVSRDLIRAEARAVARLSHPNITAVHDYGESPADGAPYVVMELLNGQPLSTRLRSGPMSWRQATQICAQVAAALAAAHDRDIVHRDIKPTNVMLTAAGAKVLDFGIAGLAGSPGEDEPAGIVFGTPAYLAPERIAGGPVVPATDVYALGLLLYRCLTDRLPWDVETTTQMIVKHMYEPPGPLPAIDGLPSAVVDLVTRCLAKEPSDRPSAVEAVRVLAEATGIQIVLPGAGGSTTPAVPDPDGAAPEGAAPQSAAQARSRRRVSRRLLAASLVALVAAASAAALLVTRAANRPNDAGAPLVACRVKFFIRPELSPAGNRVFTARVTVVNTGRTAQQPWTVRFTFPNGQRVNASEGAAFVQEGVVVRLSSELNLPPGKAITIGLAGLGAERPRPPEGFTLNGTTCDARVFAPTILPPVTGVTDPPADLDSSQGVPNRRTARAGQAPAQEAPAREAPAQEAPARVRVGAGSRVVRVAEELPRTLEQIRVVTGDPRPRNDRTRL